MKAKTQLSIFLLFSIIFSLISCDKDDEIDINQLTGKWYVYNDDPNLEVDSGVTYTFNTDKTCLIHSSSFLSDWDTIVNRTYVISYDNTLVTLYNEENRYTEQYYICQLTSSEKIWENASPGDGNSDKKLRKSKD
ncbi:MAG: hypothetical protein ACK5HT_21300 [Draconibacterium sp.]